MERKIFFLCVLFACCFHQRKVQCWKPLRSCFLLISLHIWCCSCAKGGPIHKPKPTDCKKKEKICQRPSCWLPRCLWELLHVDSNVWKVFLLCCSDYKHLLGITLGALLLFLLLVVESLSLPRVQIPPGPQWSWADTAMDTRISNASLTFPGFPLLCYHREIPFLAVLTENLSLDQVTWPAKLLLLILNNIPG